MDLNEDPSKYDDHLVDSSGKVAVFAKLAERSFDTSTVDRWFYFYPKWSELVEQIQTVVIAVFEDYFRRNQWFQQSVSVAVDAVSILNLNHQLQEMTESLDSVIDSFLHMESRGQTVFINDIHDVFGYGLEENEPLKDFVRNHTLVHRINSKNEINFIRELPEDDVRKSVSAAMEELLQRNHGWIETELRSQWRIELRLRSPRLPLELWKLVMDNLWGWDDTATLANCCLTCHEFLRWGRDYLYEHVAFSEREQIKSFFDSLSRFPYLRRLTTHLHLSKVEACTEFLLHRPPLLPNLQSVTIQDLHSPLHPSLTSIGRPFHSVRILSFNWCNFQSVLDLRRLIDGFFPNVTELGLNELRIHSSHISLPPIRPQKKPLSLSHLEFDVLNDVPPVVVRWLSWTQTPNTLNSLSLSASDLAKMLPSLGRRLQLLAVEWDIDEYDLDENLSFGADVLPVLQTLRVTQLFGSSRTHAFCHVLSRSSLASSLSSIEIQTLSDEMTEQDPIVLDDTLAQLHDRIQIAIEQSRWKFFPKLESKGVLTIPYNYAEDLWLV